MKDKVIEESMDNKLTLNQTIIYRSKGRSGFYAIVFFIVSFYFIFKLNNNVIGIICLAVAVFLSYSLYKEFIGKGERLLLDDDGIEVFGDFYSWIDINNENVLKENNDGSPSMFLIFYHRNKEIKIDVSLFDVDGSALLNLLIAYRARYENKKNN